MEQSPSTPVIAENDTKTLQTSISLPVFKEGPDFLSKTSVDPIFNSYLNDEYEIFESIYTAFYDYAKQNKTELENVIVIPKPTCEEISDDQSIKLKLTIQKLFPIDQNEKNLTKIYLSQKTYNKLKLAQPFGCFMDRIIGYKETKKILKKNRKIFAKSKFKKNFSKLDNIKSLYFNFGCLMAIINYKAKYDGRDCSIFLAKENENDKNFKITISDIGSCRNLNKNFKTNHEKAREKILKAMKESPFLPNPNNKNFIFFEQGYVEVASNLNFKDLAQSILEEFIKSKNN